MSAATEAELIQQHWHVAIRAARRFWWPNIDADALLSDAQLALLEAIREYDQTKGVPLPKHLAVVTRRRLIDLLRSRGVLRPKLKRGLNWKRHPLDCRDLRANSGYREDCVSQDYFSWLTQSLTGQERAVVRGHFAEHKQLKQIATELGVSESRCSRLLIDALDFLRYRMSAQQTA